MKRFVLILFVFLICGTQSANILGISPLPAYSHFQLCFRLVKELADRGHQVTVISPYPQKTPIKNYKDIFVEENIKFVEEQKKNLFDTNKFNPFENAKFIVEMGNILTNLTFSNKKVQDLLASEETFDLIIMDNFFNDAHVGFGEHFKAPVIILGSTSTSNHLFANPAPSSYVQNPIGAFGKHMAFFQRLFNSILNFMGDFMREFIFMPVQRELLKNYIKTDLQSDNVIYNVSLLLSNSHVSLSDAVPHVPNIIEIGGYHVKPPKKLPQDLQTFLDESKNGVILFSMGSNLKSKDLKPEVRADILKSFSKIKQNVLWKFEEDFPYLPDNVKIMKWIPQQDVLAHPNVVAFISHGGLLSTIETVYHGVPIIGIPVFADQGSNVAAAAANGYAVRISLDELSEEKLSWALNEVLNNPQGKSATKTSDVGETSAITNQTANLEMTDERNMDNMDVDHLSDSSATSSYSEENKNEMEEDQHSSVESLNDTTKRYRENVKQRSKLLSDQPLKPLAAAVYWVEHVIRHKGASHLRSAGLDLKWYEREMIDIYAFLILVTITIFVVIYAVTKKCLLSCFGRKKMQLTKRKKNK